MNVELLGHHALVEASRGSHPLSSRVGLGAVTKIVASGAFAAAGASPAVALVAGVGTGIAASKLVPLEDTTGQFDVKKIGVTLNVGEAILFPVIAGTVLYASKDDAQSKRDAAVLLATAVFGAGIAYAALR